MSDTEELFRDLFDNAPVGYHEVNAEGRLVRVNQTEASMLGYEPEEMVGHFAWSSWSKRSPARPLRRRSQAPCRSAPSSAPSGEKTGRSCP